MQACRIAAASDAAALRKCEGGQRPLPPAGEAIALRTASAMVRVRVRVRVRARVRVRVR